MHTVEELVAFYADAGRDGRGRTVDDVWQLGLEELELSHDYIQWLFPLLEPSRAQPRSPVLTAGAAEVLRRSPTVRERLVRSVRVMARFYGFSVEQAGAAWVVAPSAAFASRARVWLTPGNHNYLRHTRILKSLTLLGLRPLATAWLDCLSAVSEAHPSLVGRGTLEYWRTAVS